MRLAGAVLLLGGLLAGDGAWILWRSGHSVSPLPAWLRFLGLGLFLALVLPLMAIGIYLLRHGAAGLADAPDRRDWALMLPLFDDDGLLRLTTAVIALGRPRSEVCDLLRAAAKRGEIQGWLDLRAAVFQVASLRPDCCPRWAELFLQSGGALAHQPAQELWANITRSGERLPVGRGDDTWVALTADIQGEMGVDAHDGAGTHQVIEGRETRLGVVRVIGQV